MKQAQHAISIATQGKGLTEFTREAVAFVGDHKITTGLLTIFVRHTSASLLINENADPDVLRDLKVFFDRIAPEDFAYVHDAEGPDDMPAHIRAALTQTSLSIPIMNGVPALGTWQGIYLFEHRRAPHRRHVVMHLIGE